MSHDTPQKQGFHVTLHETTFGKLEPFDPNGPLPVEQLLGWYAKSLDDALARITALEAITNVNSNRIDELQPKPPLIRR